MPAVQVSNTQVQNLMAVSLTINKDVEVSGDDALSRESNDWDIWNE